MVDDPEKAVERFVEEGSARLSAADEYAAIVEFVVHRLGEGADDDEFAEFMRGCQVVYRDDLATGWVYYQIIDALGHGDGTGEWYLVG